MKYLVQNKKEFTIAIVTVLFTAWNVYKAIREGVLTEATLSAFILAVFTLLGLYYNMPTSKENCEHTGAMRLEKAQNKGIVTGENFTDDIEEEGEE